MNDMYRSKLIPDVGESKSRRYDDNNLMLESEESRNRHWGCKPKYITCSICGEEIEYSSGYVRCWRCGNKSCGE